MKSEKIRVMIVDDHPVVCKGLAAIIQAEPGMEVVAEAFNGKQAIQVFRECHPDITLMDLRMPVMSGVDAIRALRKEFPSASFIILTTYQGDEDIHRGISAGARGYLLKDSLRKELIEAIRTVQSGRKRIPHEVAAQIAEHASYTTLTKREIEVLQLIAAGNPNKLVADRLTVTEDTIKMHVKSILSKLGANDRTHAVTIAVKRGIIEL